MEISERYDVDSNGQGNIRWHTRNINGKKFQFCREHEQSWVRITVNVWVEDRDLPVYDFDYYEDGMTLQDLPLKTIKHTGFWPYPLHEFEN